ncbi:MAG: CapA family protein [Candidatus Gracilibacteria bacterium]|nr:CapA family protein [Candidatus Gracilibacteria bacterium]
MLEKYLYLWIILVVCTFILLILNRKNNILFKKEYITFLFQKWKIIIFLLSLFLISLVGLLGFNPTWDLWISIIMPILTFYTSPYSVGTFYRFVTGIDRSYINVFIAIILSFFSASWFYDGYNYFILLGFYPMTWYSNIFYSIPLYIMAGMFWNLNYSKKKGMFFSFSTEKWITEKQLFSFQNFGIYIIIIGFIFTSSLMYFIYLIDYQKVIFSKKTFNGEENIKKDILKKETEFNNKIKITIGGDVMLSRVVGHFNKKDYGRITKKYNPITQTGGIVFLNLESPFSKNPKDGYHASYLFGANVKNIQTLKDLKGENEMIVSLANNHIKNSGIEGLQTSIDLLNKSQIYYSGVSLKTIKNKTFTIIKSNDNKICLEAFTYDGSIYGKYKINKISKENIKKSLDLMKKDECDLNIISLHWGREYKFDPTKTQVEMAHYIIDNGADMIIGHHSHIFGKTEIYKEKPIFYSLGNYIFDQDGIINSCGGGKDCIYDEKFKKKILPVQTGVSYELIFENHKNISKIQKKHRMVNYGELREF